MAKCDKICDGDLRATFDRYDTDGSGFIEITELRNAVKEGLKDKKPNEEDIDAVTNVSTLLCAITIDVKMLKLRIESVNAFLY